MADIYVATTGNDSTGDGSSGNPYASPGKAGSVCAAGDRIYFKAGTYTITTATENVSNGVPIINGAANFGLFNQRNTQWIGYNTTVGDNPATGSRPVFKLQDSLTSAEIYCIKGSAANGVREKGFECSYIDFDCGSGNTNAGCIHSWTNYTYWRHFKAQHATGTNGAVLVWDGYEEFTDFEICNCSTHGMKVDHGASILTLIQRFSIHDLTGSGVAGIYMYPERTADPTDGLIYNITGSGATTAALVLDFNVGAKNCTIYNCRKGIYLIGRGSQTPNVENVIFDSIIDKALYSEGASNITSGAHVTDCAFRNNGTNIDTDWSHATATGTVMLSADPFTNKAGNDYTLNNTAGGGAACRNAGVTLNIGWDQTNYIPIASDTSSVAITVGNYSSAITITLPAAADGVGTVTFTQNNSNIEVPPIGVVGGTYTGSGTSGDPLVVKPTNGNTTFSVLIYADIAGSSTVAITNSFGYTNPSSISVTATAPPSSPNTRLSLGLSLGL